MRIAAPQTRRREKPGLNLSSMIDLTFLLLIYFMTTMVLLPPEDQLNPNLQTEQQDAASGAQSDFQPQIVEVINAEGAPRYRLGPRLLATQADLQAALEPLPKDTGVFIRVFDQVPVGYAVAALQAAHDAGFTQVTYVPGEVTR